MTPRDKLPAMQFYPGDWRKDPGVQALDFHDRGIWFELLCMMHESDSRGKLTLNGRPMPDAAIARNLGITEAEWKETRSRIEAYGVAGVDEDGTLYNRRMVRDEAKRERLAEAGRKGGRKSRPKPTGSQGEAKKEAKQSPSVSSSVSTSVETTSPKPEKAPVSDLWAVWIEELGGGGRPPTLTPKRRQVLAKLWEEQLQDADDPIERFRKTLQAVKRSEHHMSKREYQYPESLFRNPERRDRWAQAGTNGTGGQIGPRERHWAEDL